jgi:hypothetical protein
MSEGIASAFSAIPAAPAEYLTPFTGLKPRHRAEAAAPG